MKLIGLTLEQVTDATAAILMEHSLPTNGITWVGSTTSGYFKVNAHSAATKTVFSASHNGASHYSPCACFFKALYEHLGHGSWAMWLHKNKIHSYSSYGKIHAAMAGFPCAHAGAQSIEAQVSAPHVSAPVAAPVHHAPSGAPVALPVLGGDLLTDGETTDLAAVKSAIRGVYPATCSMYVLEELRAAASGNGFPKSSSSVADHRLADYCGAVNWVRRLRSCYEGYSARLARNFFDYCVLASFGEALHGNGSKYTLGDTSLPHSACNSHPDALQYDPRNMLPVLVWCFNAHQWGGSYGGPKWGKIAQSAALYYTLGASAPVVFADHCVDLAHNGGLAFNKGYILRNPSDHAGYTAMLDTKRHGSLLGSRLKLEVTEPVYRLATEAANLGIIPACRAALEIKTDLVVPTVRWGVESLTVYLGKHTVAPAINSNTESEVSHDGPTETFTTRTA